ncbi:BA14K family protein [Neorhizobium petrolearium]|uniref:BA14K family protein n=1 Tax=Neorhizobium petrolearium TaxID=515361 RepID=UPI003F15BD94
MKCPPGIGLLAEEQFPSYRYFGWQKHQVDVFMRKLLTNLLLASCLLPIAAGGMQLSDLAEPTAPHNFTDLHGEPLWPSEVRRVDPNQQAYERLPAVLSANTMVAEAKTEERVRVTLGSSKSADIAGERGPQSEVLLAELQAVKAQEWCGARYRSYDPSDNTYQPYGGGPRRTCAAPVEMTTPSVRQVADIGGTSGPDAHARWCMERYSSYRIEDDIYRPFTGGRKRCPGPGSQSASNSIGTPGDATVAQF